jgi:site-specific DNA recombinase
MRPPEALVAERQLEMVRRIRCAIYTRKSSEEGLDQDFNSLDAQAEACAAYVASQKAAGWVLVPTRYDDGGLSGGTLERSALQRLLADIEAGLVNQIVVYKIDRLTRSLSDFAQIVDRLDAAGASFVSVTQSFNTATSMGRLTLNMLLSFARFEREGEAERICIANPRRTRNGSATRSQPRRRRGLGWAGPCHSATSRTVAA